MNFPSGVGQKNRIVVVDHGPTQAIEYEEDSGQIPHLSDGTVQREEEAEAWDLDEPGPKKPARKPRVVECRMNPVKVQGAAATNESTDSSSPGKKVVETTAHTGRGGGRSNG